jgi:hypothetical protein
MSEGHPGESERTALEIANEIAKAWNELWRDKPGYQFLPVAPYTYNGRAGYLVLGPEKVAFVPDDGEKYEDGKGYKVFDAPPGAERPAEAPRAESRAEG